jgi:hypothetical protein
MSREIESIAKDLFDKIRSRFESVTLGDAKAQAIHDPEQARFMNIQYTAGEPGQDAQSFGTVTLSLIDETSLKVYYSNAITHDMDETQRREWYEFLRNLRQFARRNLLTFDTRDISKASLDIRDLQQQTKSDTVSHSAEVPVTESRFYGSGNRLSFEDAGTCRIRIHHSESIDPDQRGARGRKISAIFLETEAGERFRMEHQNLYYARALAEHITQGGTMYDDIAESIRNVATEMTAMRSFVNGVRRRQFEDAETQHMVESARRRYTELKQRLRGIPGHYAEFRENWAADASVLAEVDVDVLRERFAKKIYPNFESALPYVQRAHDRYAQETLAEEFATWADSLVENLLGDPDQVTALQHLIQSPITAGVNGVDAVAKLTAIFTDDSDAVDDLRDAIYHLASDDAGSQGPDADVRPMLKNWLSENDPELLNQLTWGPENTAAAQTNEPPQVSPKSAEPAEYGVTGMDAPVTENIELKLIRTLAGLR